MSLLDQLKRMSAHAADIIKNMAEAAGAEAVVSVVISHPGRVDDAFVVGDHTLDDLFAILIRLGTGGRVECDVTSTYVGPDEPAPKGTVQ